VKKSFSWSGAVLAGFGVLRREPGVLLVWSLVGLVFGLAGQVIAANAQMFKTSSQAAAWLWPMTNLARGVVIAVGMAIFSAAVYRAVLLPQGETRGRMRFGSDEVRLTLVWMLQGLMLVVLSIVALLPAFALSTLMAKQQSAVTGILGTVVVLGVLIGWIALLARLSLAAPMALAEGRWSVPAAWRMTRGHAWKILAAHVPVLLGLGLVFSLAETLYILALHAMHLDVSPAILRDTGSLAGVLTPARLGFTLLTAILGAAGAAILYAPAAAIYRDLKGEEPADQAAVFD
jgi:hypothetical protein